MTVNNTGSSPSTNVANTTPQTTETNNQPTAATPTETANVTSVPADGFDQKTNQLNLGTTQPDFKLSPEGQKKAKAALDKYNNRLETIMNRGHKTRGLALAAGAAGGKQPYGPGDKFDPADVDALKGATKDLVMNMPIGTLNAGAQKKIDGLLQGTDLSLKDVQNKSINELKGELGDKAKKIGEEVADNLKSNKPGVYYGLGITGAAAIGAYGYAKGSKGLEQLGIKPEFKKNFFDNKVTANAKGSWDAEMKNPNLALGVNTKLKTSEHGRLAFGAKANVGGPSLGDIDFKGGSANMSYTHGLGKKKSLNANLNANFDAEGKVKSGRSEFNYNSGDFKLGLGAKHGENMDVLGYDLKGNFKLGDNTTANTNLNFDRKFGFEKGNANLSHNFEKNHSLSLNSNFDSKGFNDISAKYAYRKNNWDIGAGVKHDFLTDRTSANLSAGYSIRDNFSVGIIGSTDGGSDHRIGLGVGIKF